MIVILVVLLLVVALILLLGHFVGHWFDKKDKFHNIPSLGFVVLVKDEGDIIEEWIMHHKKEGVTEFIIIDNGSKDNGPTLVRKYPEVTIIKDLRCPFNCKGEGHQAQMITDACKKAKSDWLIVGDADEFWYAPKGKITDFLKTVPKNIDQITTEWLLFGSNGYINQPSSVVTYFTKRTKRPTKARKWTGNEKSIIRRKAIKSNKVHQHYGITKENVIYFNTINPNNPLRLNHYRAQSKNKWFSRRSGRVGSPGGAASTNDKWWAAIDKNEVIDLELANKKY